MLVGTGLLHLTATGEATLDRAQLVVGRLLLGFSSRCVSPAVLLSLAWVRWSCAIGGKQLHLLCRLFGSPCRYITEVLEVSAAVPSSWYSQVAAECACWLQEGLPATHSEQRAAFQRWKAEVVNSEAERCLLERLAQPSLGLLLLRHVCI